jgi:MYXO-CTERM domain-containing protein
VVAFALPSSPYLIVSFEDLAGGGDRDYNDVAFAVDIGAINVQRLLSTPEPAAWMSLLALGLLAALYRRRLAAA